MTLGGDRQNFNLNLVPETHERVSRTGVRMLSQLELPPGRYQIRVGAHESTGRTIGTVPYDLEVPDYAKACREILDRFGDGPTVEKVFDGATVEA